MTSFPKSSAEIITEIADHLIQSEGLPPDTPRPTLADLETWHQDGKCPLEAHVETERRLKLLLLDQITWSPRDEPVILYQLSQDGNIKWSSTPLGPVTWALETTIAELYEEWRKVPENERPPSPLSPIIRAWLNRAEEVKPERRPRGILPRDVANRTALLPGFDAPSQPPTQPGLVKTPAPAMAHLPGLVPDAPALPALLRLYDRVQGMKQGRKGAVPLPMRLFIEGCLSLPTGARDGRLRQMRFTIREIAGEWLAWDLGSYRPSGASTGAALKTALGQLNQLHIDMPNQGWYYPLLLEAVQGLNLDSQVAILSRLPSGSGVGPPIDRRMLRKLGKQSAPAYRALLYLACEWDRYGGRNGRLVRPTRPEVLRDPTGHVLEATGTVALEQDRRPATSPHHPLAVHTGGRELNPARSRYPGYEGDALIGLCYHIDGIPKDQRRKYLTRAVKTLEYMQSIGAVSIERMNPRWKHGLPWRIMPPDIIQNIPDVISCPV